MASIRSPWKQSGINIDQVLGNSDHARLSKKQKQTELEDVSRYVDLVRVEGYTPLEAQAIIKRKKANLKALEESK